MAAVQDDPVSTLPQPIPTPDGLLVAAPSGSERVDAFNLPMKENYAQHSADTHLAAGADAMSLAELRKSAPEELVSTIADALSNAKETVETTQNGTRSDPQVEGKDGMMVHVKDATVDSGTTVVSAASDATTIIGANDTGDTPGEEDTSYTNAEDSRAGTAEEAVVATAESHDTLTDVNPSAEEAPDSAAAISTIEMMDDEPAHSGPVVKNDPAVSTAVEAEAPSTEQEVTQTASGELNEAVQPDLGNTSDLTQAAVEEKVKEASGKGAEEDSAEKPAEAEASPVVREQAAESHTKEDGAAIKMEEAEVSIQVEEADKGADMASAVGASVINSPSVDEAPIQVEVVAPTPGFVDDRRLEEGSDAEATSDVAIPTGEDGAVGAEEPASSTPVIANKEELTPEGAATPKAEGTDEPDVVARDKPRDAETPVADVGAEGPEKTVLVETPAPVTEEKAGAEESVEVRFVAELSVAKEPSPEPALSVEQHEGHSMGEPSVIETAGVEEDPVVETSVSEPIVQDVEASLVEDVSALAEEQRINDRAPTPQEELSAGDKNPVGEGPEAEEVVAVKEPEAEERLTVEETSIVDAQPAVEPASKTEDIECMAAEGVMEGRVAEEKPAVDETVTTEASTNPEAEEDVATEGFVAPVAEDVPIEIEPTGESLGESLVEKVAVKEEEGQEIDEENVAKEQAEECTTASEIAVKGQPATEEPATETIAEVVVVQEAVDEPTTGEKPLTEEKDVGEGPTIGVTQVASQPIEGIPTMQPAAEVPFEDESVPVEKEPANGVDPVVEEMVPAKSASEVPTVKDTVTETGAEDKANDDVISEPQTWVAEIPVETPVAEGVIQQDSAVERDPVVQDNSVIGDEAIVEDKPTTGEKASIKETQSALAVKGLVAGQSTVEGEPTEIPVDEVPTAEAQSIGEQYIAAIEEPATGRTQETPAPSGEAADNVVGEGAPAVETPPTKAVSAEERPDAREKDEPVFENVIEEAVGEVAATDLADAFDEGRVVQESFVINEPLEADTTSERVIVPEPLAKEEDIAEAPAVEVTATHQSLTEETTCPEKLTLDVPAAIDDPSRPERPKSPWTPSFQVTTIGQGASLPAEEDIPTELLDTEDTMKGIATTQPAIVIEGKVRSAQQPAEEAGTIEATSLSWTPSYSVHSQGSPSPTHKSLEPEQSTEDKNTGREVVLAADDKEQGETFASAEDGEQEIGLSATETNLESLIPEPEEVVDAPEFQLNEYPTTEPSGPPRELEAETAVAPVTATLPELPTAGREQTQGEASTPPGPAPPADAASPKQSFIEENVSLTSPSEQIRPISPSWVPSYSVSRQGSPLPEQVLPPPAAAVASEPSLASAPGPLQKEVEQEPAENHTIPITPSLIINDVQLESEESQSAEKDPETPWTPSYSVIQQGPATVKGDNIEITEFIAQPADSKELEAENQQTGPIPAQDSGSSAFSPAGLIGVGVVGGPIAALAASPIIGRSNDTNHDVDAKPEDCPPTNRDTVPESKPQSKTFPTVEIPTEEHTKPNVGVLPPLDENSTLDTTSNNLSSPVSPRKRLESTTSSRLFPGGWFSNTSKIPDERTSLEVAQGVFTGANKQGTTGEETPVSPALDPITPIREQSSSDKRKWCIIM